MPCTGHRTNPMQWALLSHLIRAKPGAPKLHPCRVHAGSGRCPVFLRSQAPAQGRRNDDSTAHERLLEAQRDGYGDISAVLSLGLTVSFYREPLLLGGCLPSFLLSLHFFILGSGIPKSFSEVLLGAFGGWQLARCQVPECQSLHPEHLCFYLLDTESQHAIPFVKWAQLLNGAKNHHSRAFFSTCGP